MGENNSLTSHKPFKKSAKSAKSPKIKIQNKFAIKSLFTHFCKSAKSAKSAKLKNLNKLTLNSLHTHFHKSAKSAKNKIYSKITQNLHKNDKNTKLAKSTNEP